MGLSRSQAEKNGVVFSHEANRYGSDPDQEVWAADVTIDGHTEHVQGKSEEAVLEQAHRILLARGRLEPKERKAAEAKPLPTQSADV